MIKGIGIDLVELARIVPIVEQEGTFIARVLSPRERAVFDTLSMRRKAEFLGGRFACKEAFAKAYGTGIGKTVGFHDVEILPNENGAPEVFTKLFVGQIFVAITHTKEYAAAQIILEEKEEI